MFKYELTTLFKLIQLIDESPKFDKAVLYMTLNVTNYGIFTTLSLMH